MDGLCLWLNKVHNEIMKHISFTEAKNFNKAFGEFKSFANRKKLQKPLCTYLYYTGVSFSYIKGLYVKSLLVVDDKSATIIYSIEIC